MDDCKNLVVIDLEDYPENAPSYKALQTTATELSATFTEGENINQEEPGPSAANVDNFNFQTNHSQRQFASEEMVIIIQNLLISCLVSINCH